MNEEHIYRQQLRMNHQYLLSDKPKTNFKMFKGETKKKKVAKNGR